MSALSTKKFSKFVLSESKYFSLNLSHHPHYYSKKHHFWAVLGILSTIAFGLVTLWSVLVVLFSKQDGGDDFPLASIPVLGSGQQKMEVVQGDAIVQVNEPVFNPVSFEGFSDRIKRNSKNKPSIVFN